MSSRVIRPLPPELTRALFAAGDQPLVLVEGVDDKSVFDTWFLDRLANITFYATSGVEDVHTFLPQVLTIAARDRIYGIIDRDYASDEDTAWSPDADPHLFLLTRHELENYLLEPAALHAELRTLYGAKDTPPEPGEIAAQLLDFCRKLAPLIAANWVLRDEPTSKVFADSFPLSQITRAFLVQQVAARMSLTEADTENRIAEKEAVIAPLLNELATAHTRIKGKHLFYHAYQQYIFANSVCNGMPMPLFRNRMAERTAQTTGVPADIRAIVEYILGRA